eukprot:5376153-Pyramimonas_sp.AAC.1
MQPSLIANRTPELQTIIESELIFLYGYVAHEADRLAAGGKLILIHSKDAPIDHNWLWLRLN